MPELDNNSAPNKNLFFSKDQARYSDTYWIKTKRKKKEKTYFKAQRI